MPREEIVSLSHYYIERPRCAQLCTLETAFPILKEKTLRRQTNDTIQLQVRRNSTESMWTWRVNCNVLDNYPMSNVVFYPASLEYSLHLCKGSILELWISQRMYDPHLHSDDVFLLFASIASPITD